MKAGRGTLFATLVLLGATGQVGRGVAQAVTKEDFAAASRLLEGNLRGTVRNQSVEPRWLGDRGSFWYRRDEPGGASYAWFDAATRTKRPLFDHGALAAALSKVLGGGEAAATAEALGLSDVVVTADRRRLHATRGGKAVACELVPMACAVSDRVPVDPALLPSPNGARAVAIRRHNLVVRDLATGQETALTTDGGPYFAYGSLTDQSLVTIPRRRAGTPLPPVGTSWSPDGRYVLAPRVDERAAAVNPFVEWVPQDGALRPVVHEIRTTMTGDRDRTTGSLFAFDMTTGTRAEVALPPPFHQGGPTPGSAGATPVGWSVERGAVYLIVRTYGAQSVGLLRVELATGQGTVVVNETSPTRVETNAVEYNQPNVRVIGDGAEAIWYSARSGWGHLYRYDARTGALLNPITSGDWAVVDIIEVDERRREVYFTGGGREPGRDPYYRHLYRASLDGGAVTLLTDTDADHHFDAPLVPSPALRRSGFVSGLIRPDAGVFLDTYSTVSEPPVTVVRSTRDGRVIAEIERADASALFATGWTLPSRERVKAADGVTDLYPVFYRPLRPVAGGKHPIIDAAYGGPQVIVAPRNFIEAYSVANPLGESGLARLGFAMMTMDGRGTPYRSRAFRDAGYPAFTQVGVDDHAAAIRQLARRHPEIDSTRVGVFGNSWGGTFAAQAILSRPEFYAVAVSAAGAYDYAALYSGFEGHVGVPRYADGSILRTKPNEKPANWGPLDVTAMAGNLRGHLLLIYSDLDENVPPAQAFRLIDALVRANKPYDLLYLPNRTHTGNRDPFAVKTAWNYFIEHLLGERPVADAVVTVTP
ncbi:MAG: DPP IV N-terminal domain-containing protein [Gemmatimonadales bacterium]